MALPNYILFGAAKGGTTALYHYLNQHPQIFMSAIKEPNYFILAEGKADFEAAVRNASPEVRQDSLIRYNELMSEGVPSFRDYCALFDAATTEKAIGEASIRYLYYPQAAERIRACVPDVRLIAVLRHPVDRALSSFAHRIRFLREHITDFEEAIKREDLNVHNFWWGSRHYLRQGFYGQQLKRYFEVFDRRQMKVYLYDDFIQDSAGVMRDIFRFLEVDDTFAPQMGVKHNVGKFPKNRMLHALLVKPNALRSFVGQRVPVGLRDAVRNLRQRNMGEAKPKISPELRQRLLPIYREDILRLQELIQRDLSHWLEEAR